MWVVLPVKSLGESKQRLADVLDESQRKSLAESMLKDVLTAVTSTHSIDHVLVVTRDDDVAAIARDYGARVLVEPGSCKGLNQAVALGVSYAEQEGAGRVLVLHGDIPLVNTKDLDYLVQNHLQGSLTIVPDKYEDGSNGLLFDLPCRLIFHYGTGSFGKHKKASGEIGMPCIMVELPDLTLDIDSPEDLLELADRLRVENDLATSRCLFQNDMPQALATIAERYASRAYD